MLFDLNLLVIPVSRKEAEFFVRKFLTYFECYVTYILKGSNVVIEDIKYGMKKVKLKSFAVNQILNFYYYYYYLQISEAFTFKLFLDL